MKFTFQCFNCDHKFEATSRKGDIKCPHCGAILESSEGELSPSNESFRDEVRPVLPKEDRIPSKLGSLAERTEFAEDAPQGKVARSDDEDEIEDATETDFHDKATQMVASPELVQKMAQGSRVSLLSWLGPTLLATCLFLSWVVYDKAIRKHFPTVSPEALLAEDELHQALRAYHAGDRTAARTHANESIKFNPSYELAQEFIRILNSDSNVPTTK